VIFLIGKPFSHICEFYGCFLLCYVLMNVWRFLIMYVRLVLEGGLANLYGMV
jgi:hypothetical protein